MAQIQTTLRQLRLSGLAQSLPVRLQEAAAARLLGRTDSLQLAKGD